MYGRQKLHYSSYLRPFLIICAGLGIGLLFLKLALPKRDSSVFSPPVSVSLPNAGGKMNFSGPQAPLTGTPTNQAVAGVSTTLSRNCTYTSDYWQVHPQSWMADNVVIGQFSFTKAEALAVMNRNTPDQVLLLQKQFLAAVLNILKGADPAAVEKTIEEASSWIDAHPPQIDLPETEKRKGADLARALENFNTGVNGPGLCPDQPATATPTVTPTPTPTATATAIEFIPTPTEATRTPEIRRESAPSSASPTSVSGSTPAPVATEPPPTLAPTPAPTEGAAPTSPPPPAQPTPQPTNPPQPTSPPPADTPAPVPTNAPPGQVKPTKEPKPTKGPNPNDVPTPMNTPQPTVPSVTIAP